MIQVRKSGERGYFDHGWLKTFHTFSFGDYQDEQFMGFGPLRVINEDIILKGEGFPTHGHKDMEIITYILSGAIAHKDSTGSTGIIRPGEIQKMTAGSGIRHSEYNALKDQDTHLMQIWLMPDKNGLKPGYFQKDFSDKLNTGEPVLLCSKSGEGDSLAIHQNTKLWACRTETPKDWKLALTLTKKAWIQVTKGKISLLDKTLKAGDGAAIVNESELLMKLSDQSEVLVFDL